MVSYPVKHHHFNRNDAVLQLLSGAGAILLQREIPEAVNLEVAKVSCVLRSTACVFSC